MNDLERSFAFTASALDLREVRALPIERLPSFSVVIPSFNQVNYLSATLESVLTQGYPRVEIFIADGGSTDGSVAVIADFSSRHPDVVRYTSGPDGGHYHGVNRGISQTSGDIIAWINSDDLYVADAFWKVAAFFHFNRAALVVYGRNEYVDDCLNVVTEYPVDWSPLLKEQRRRMLHFCLPPQPSLFFRRSAVTLCGALDHKILDYELWLRWQKNLPFFFMDELLSRSRLQKDAISVNADLHLLEGICDAVHLHYGVVPYSWALRYEYNRAYGAAWAKGESPPITKVIRLRAWLSWLRMNLQRLHRAAALVMREQFEWLRDCMRASS